MSNTYRQETTRPLLPLCLAMMLSSLGTSMANAGLPTWVQTFDVPLQRAQWIVLAYLLSVTCLIVAAGRLGDRYGRRRVLLCGLGVFTAASAFCAMAPTLWWLVAARALQGCGAAVMMSLSVAMAGEAAPPGKLGRAMGLLGTMSAVGTAMAPPVGGLLIASAGWQWMFLLNVPLGLVTMVLALRWLPKGIPANRGEGIDVVGTSLLVVALGAYALAMTAPAAGGASAQWGFLAFAALAACGFMAVEASASSPLIAPHLFRGLALGGSLVMSALVATVIMSTLVVGPFYLTQAVGLDTAQMGLVLSIGPVVVALTGVPAGRMTDRLGPHKIVLAGLCLMAGGAMLLCITPLKFGVSGYVVPVVLITLGYGLFQTANNSAVMKDVPPEQRGMVSGMLSLSRNLGLITGASLMGAVYARAFTSAEAAVGQAHATATGLHVTFALALALIAVAISISLRQQLHTATARNLAAALENV